MVHPNHCKDLQLCGVTGKTIFDWHISNNVAELVTYYFDNDSYYYGAKEKLWQLPDVRKPQILPAYDLMSMQAVIPGNYSLIRTDYGLYELAIEAIWGCREERAERLPDVFALMVLQCIRRRILDADKINKQMLELIN